MNSPRIALVTARAARGLDDDMTPLLAALRDTGAQAVECDWDDDDIDWSRFDLALLRSSWDYSQRLPQFLAWIERTSAQTRLLNPPDAIRWNTDKHYLRELKRNGVLIVPSLFAEPGDDAGRIVGAFLTAHPQLSEFVIKPSVGAGSRDAQRHHIEDRDAASAHLQRLLDARRSALLQPYLHNVDEHGETALVFFDGVFSHAIRKGPLLKRGAGATGALFAAEHITPRTPSAEEIEIAQYALAAVPFDQPLLYARIDLLQADQTSDEQDMPRLLELKLVEPSVFLDHADGAAARFAKAIVRRAA